MKKVYLIDDHGLVRGGLRKILESSSDFTVVGEASSVEEALGDIKRELPELVTLDLQMPGVCGVEAVEVIRQASAETKILIISARLNSAEIRDLVAAGVQGYVPKEVRSEELIRAVETVLQGEAYFSSKAAMALVSGVRGVENGSQHQSLSKRQIQTLRLIEKGKKTNEIAEILMLSPKTIEKYRSEILRRLGCRNQIEALDKARRLNIL